MQRAIILAALAFTLAACMGQPPVTSLGEDVPSYCIKSRAAYEGHMDFCAVRTCEAFEIAEAKFMKSKSDAICAKQTHTAADLAAMKRLARDQRDLGRRK